jgi:hypothetical protein
MRPLFLYCNPVDFGQPGDSGFGPNAPQVADQRISRYLEMGEVKRYKRYAPLLDRVREAAQNRDLPTVLFCVGAPEKQLRERLRRLLDAGAAKLLVYLANNADNDSVRHAVFEAGSLCCWDFEAFPEKPLLNLICATDFLPYRIWEIRQHPIPRHSPVFVACSYEPERRLRFEYWIRTALSLAGLRAHFADGYGNAQGAQGVGAQTFDQIGQCHFAIAILDHPYNPNVMLEIGAMNNQVPLIIYRQRHPEAPALPVDIRDRVHDCFTNPEDLGYCLHHGLRDAVQKAP